MNFCPYFTCLFVELGEIMHRKLPSIICEEFVSLKEIDIYKSVFYLMASVIFRPSFLHFLCELVKIRCEIIHKNLVSVS